MRGQNGARGGSELLADSCRPSARWRRGGLPRGSTSRSVRRRSTSCRPSLCISRPRPRTTWRPTRPPLLLLPRGFGPRPPRRSSRPIPSGRWAAPRRKRTAVRRQWQRRGGCGTGASRSRLDDSLSPPLSAVWRRAVARRGGAGRRGKAGMRARHISSKVSTWTYIKTTIY